jgi:hypothetical protein
MSERGIEARNCETVPSLLFSVGANVACRLSWLVSVHHGSGESTTLPLKPPSGLAAEL